MGNNCCTHADSRDKDKQVDLEKIETTKGSKKDKSSKVKKERKEKKEKKVKKDKTDKKTKTNVGSSNQEPQAEKVQEYDENNLASLIPETTKGSLSDEDFEYVKNGRETAIEQFEKYNDDGNWTLLKDKDGITIYKDAYEKNGCKVKRVTTVDLGIDKVKNKITDFEFLKSINDKIEELEVVTEIDDNTKVVYQKMKGNFLVSSRDMCYCACVFDCRNGDKVVCNYSVVHDSCPETKSVRGELMIYFYLHKISSSKTEIRSIFHINLKGSIGSMVYNKFADSQYDAFKLMKEKLLK